MIKLETMLNSVSMLRPIGLPNDFPPCVVIIDKDNIPHLSPWLAANHVVKVQYIVVTEGIADKSLNGIEILDLSALGTLGAYEKVWFRPTVYRASCFLAAWSAYGIEHVWFITDEPLFLSHRPIKIDFYKHHIAELNAVYALLENDEDRGLYAALIKATCTGDASYIPINSHKEYHHPLVKPTKGDVMIDGGVSDVVYEEINFINDVGSDGKIYAFEPIEWMSKKASDSLSSYKNISILNYGLADKPGTVPFVEARYSSRRANDGDSVTIDAKMISIDQFVEDNGLKKVDCIKLDIEGGELLALEGSVQTIRKFKPKLIVCLYHKSEDMYEIPLKIKEIEPSYRLYISHHSISFLDTILYAYCK